MSKSHMSYVKASFFSALSVFTASFVLTALLFSYGGAYAIVVALIVAVVATLVGIVGCLLVAIPTYMYFKSRNIDNPTVFNAIGFIAPILIFLLPIQIPENGVLNGGYIFGFSVIIGLFGLLAMSVFWHNMNQEIDKELP